MAKIAGIYWDDTAAAPGISLSVYFSGCHFHCPGCHNPEAQNFEYGEEYTAETATYISMMLNKNGVERRLSILGGEPLEDDNIPAVSQLIEICKFDHPDLKIYLWSGYTIEELQDRVKNNPILQNILNKIDYLIDGQFILEQRDITLPLRGSSNQRIIKMHEDEI